MLHSNPTEHGIQPGLHCGMAYGAPPIKDSIRDSKNWSVANLSANYCGGSNRGALCGIFYLWTSSSFRKLISKERPLILYWEFGVDLFVGADDDNGEVVVLGGCACEVTYVFDNIVHQVFSVLGRRGFCHVI